ncbi:DUF6183 family protein [Streptomyces sp. NPDC002888]|uniref:DUF6183 family protein n=1 Tax=Streptomyces sp. NPDC002888 TaxID=3364668 RepID=UPI00368707B9
MTDEMETIVRTLPELEKVGGVWEVVDRRHAQGDVTFPADLGIALARRYGRPGAERVWQYGSVFDHLLRLLTTTPGAENVRQALRLIAVAGTDNRNLERSAASMLASGQAAQDLAVVFAGGGSGPAAGASEELRACLVHELVLRGVAVADTPEFARWAMSPHWRFHPLAWLPLVASPVEANAGLPHYSVNGSSYGMPYGTPKGGVPVGDARAPVPSAVETTPRERETRMAEAVANWTTESNGRSEACTFELSEPLGPGAVPGTLATLGLECLIGLEGVNGLTVKASSAAGVWRVLFAAASTGGAYSHGCRGAYGRLAAWRSLAGLCGAPEGASAEEVEARASACTWYGFEAPTDWYEQVAWDIGLAAVSPDGRELAVLAATDTD